MCKENKKCVVSSSFELGWEKQEIKLSSRETEKSGDAICC